MKKNIFCIFFSLLITCNCNTYSEKNQNQKIELISNNSRNTNSKVKKYLPFVLPFVALSSVYLIYNKLNKEHISSKNQLKLYTKLLNKITLRIIKYGSASTGLLIANTDNDPFVVKDKTGNNLATAIVSPNNQACRDGDLAGTIESKGGEIIKDDKQKWITEGKNKNLGKDDYTGESVAIKYGTAKLGRSGNLKQFKNIIHTVGPYVDSGTPSTEQIEQLKNSYINSCNIAAKNNIQRIVFPPISLGSFNFPSRTGAEISIRSIKHFSNGDTGSLKYIDIWMIDDGNNYPFVEEAIKILGPSD